MKSKKPVPENPSSSNRSPQHILEQELHEIRENEDQESSIDSIVKLQSSPDEAFIAERKVRSNTPSISEIEVAEALNEYTKVGNPMPVD